MTVSVGLDVPTQSFEGLTPGQFIHCPDAVAQRLDISLESAQEWLKVSGALLIRWGLLTRTQLYNPKRFRRGLCIVGAPYGGKTTTLRLLLETLQSPKGRSEERLADQFSSDNELKLIIPDTSRKRRVLIGELLSEQPGDSYWFYDRQVMYERIKEDQQRFQQRLRGNHGSETMRRYIQWCFFADNLYGIDRKRLWNAASERATFLYDGSLEPAEVLQAFFPNLEIVSLVSSWYAALDTRMLADRGTMGAMLATYRPDQSIQEQKFRVAYGAVITGLIQEAVLGHLPDERSHTDHVFSLVEGKESNQYLVGKLLHIIIDQAKDQSHQLMLESARNFLKRNAAKIEAYAWSTEIESRALSLLPSFVASALNRRGTRKHNRYHFASPLNQRLSEPTVYLPSGRG